MSENHSRDKVLVIDAGNSCLKWAIYADGALSLQDNHVYRLAQPDLGIADAFARLPNDLALVLAGSVATSAADDILAKIIRQKFALDVHFQQVQPTFGGLTIAYNQPSALGVDRWLAMLGARTLQEGAFCVADCGTALTLDCIDKTGLHRGGVIVPGHQLMQQSLLTGAAKINNSQDTLPRSIFATSTGAAVNAGSTFALAAVLDRFIDEAKLLLSAAPIVVVTGGGRSRLLRFSARDLIEIPDLVLLGLALVYDTDLT